MTEELETTIDRPKIRRPRPVLIVSEDSAALHKNLLQRLLLGLADNSISPVVVCPPQYKLDSVALPAVEIIRHPFFNIPFIFNNKNKQILLESISKLRPNIIHCLCPSKVALARNLSKALNLNYVLSFNSIEKHCKTLEISAKKCSAFFNAFIYKISYK